MVHWLQASRTRSVQRYLIVSSWSLSWTRSEFHLWLNHTWNEFQVFEATCFGLYPLPHYVNAYIRVRAEDRMYLNDTNYCLGRICIGVQFWAIHFQPLEWHWSLLPQILYSENSGAGFSFQERTIIANIFCVLSWWIQVTDERRKEHVFCLTGQHELKLQIRT